jgi:Mg-chelatase subunit ChlD
VALKPLKRRPKELDEAPMVFRPAARGTLVVEGDDDQRPGGRRPPATGIPAPQGWVATTEQGERRALEERDDAASVAEVRRLTEVIARRLSARKRPRDRAVARGSGALVSVPYRYGSDDIDLDRTLEVLTERPVPEDTDIIVRERMHSRRALALVVDVSGSMRGEKIKIAAAAVAALSGELADDDLAVVAFWKHAVVLKPLEARRSPTQVLDDLVRVPAKGLTNVGIGLAVALEELARSRARRRRVILLSDAVHNAGPDPRLLAARLPRLDVLREVDGEHDADLGADLARVGRGQVVPVRNHRDVAPGLNRILAG